jgi:hypothetical protein
MFAGNAVALEGFRHALLTEGRFNPTAFQNRQNYFAKRNITAVVTELPLELVGAGKVRAWATVSLVGHAPEVQLSRFGLSLLTHLFLSHVKVREDDTRSSSVDYLARFSGYIGGLAERLTTLAGSSANPADYAKRLVARLCPMTLSYELDTAAAFDFVGLNGRALTDDAMDVILTLATNTAPGDGVAPDRSRTRGVFPTSEHHTRSPSKPRSCPTERRQRSNHFSMSNCFAEGALLPGGEETLVDQPFGGPAQ